MRLLPLVLIPAALIGVAAPAAAPQGRDRGPGVAGERQGDTLAFRVAGFDQLQIGTAGTVDVRVGPAFAVRVSGPEEALANLRVVRIGPSLEIGRRYEGRPWTASDRSVRIAVTLPRLVEFGLGGSGAATIDQVAGERFEGALGGSGTLTIGRLAVGHAEFALGGSGNIMVAGTADSLKLSVGGSGDFRGGQLRARDASVSVGGSGNVTASVAGNATVSAAGSATIDLGDAARCSVSKVGSARVRCG